MNEKDILNSLIKWVETQISSNENSLNSYSQGLCRAYKNVLVKIRILKILINMGEI